MLLVKTGYIAWGECGEISDCSTAKFCVLDLLFLFHLWYLLLLLFWNGNINSSTFWLTMFSCTNKILETEGCKATDSILYNMPYAFRKRIAVQFACSYFWWITFLLSFFCEVNALTEILLIVIEHGRNFLLFFYFLLFCY